MTKKQAERPKIDAEAVTRAMRTYEQYGGALRYLERDKWHTCDLIAMRKVLEEFSEDNGDQSLATSDPENWASSETVARLLSGPYEAEQDEGEVTLVFQQGTEAVSAIFDRRGVCLVRSPSTPGFKPVRVAWADIIKAAR